MRRSVLFACAIVICSACAVASDFSSLPLDAQKAISAAIERDLNPAISTQHFTLTASDGRDGDDFGRSVAIDGDTVVVGALYADAAYVFVKPRGGWQNMTQTARLTFSQQGSFGYSVAISGNTIVALGAYIVDGSAQQVACVFVKPAGGWTNTTETADLTVSNLSAGSELNAVAISGSTIVAGAPNYNGEPGTAYVFVEPVGGWANMTQTAELSASDAADYNRFGISVSLSGNTAIVGEATCNGTDDAPGAAYVYVEPLTGWVNMDETAELSSSDEMMCDGFGSAVSIGSNTAVVGAGGNGLGAAYVFVEPPGGWVSGTETAKLGSIPAAGGLGDSVFITGTVIAAGAPVARSAGPQGAAFIFIEPHGGWKSTSEYNLRLAVPFNYAWDDFGSSIAVSGKTAVIGAPTAPTSPPCKPICQAGPGEAFVFVKQ